MKKFIKMVTLFAVLLAMLTLPAGVAAQEQETDPAAVVEAAYAAVQANDLERGERILPTMSYLCLCRRPQEPTGLSWEKMRFWAGTRIS